MRPRRYSSVWSATAKLRHMRHSRYAILPTHHVVGHCQVSSMVAAQFPLNS